MSVLAFVPARCNSKSIPLKNIKLFCGKPLIFWTLNELNKTAEIDEIIVATDCDEIENTVIGFGLEKVKIYRRKGENAQDSSSTESVILEYATNQKLAVDTTFMLVQCTSPFTSQNDFSLGLKEYKNHDSLLSCVTTKRFFWKKDGSPYNYDYKNRPRRQDFEGLLMENGAFYINSIENINKFKNRLSGDIGFYEMPEYTGIEIDEEDDWVIAEQLMEKHTSAYGIKTEKIKLVLSDLDGVLTDGSMYYTENGDEMKKFHTYDGAAFAQLREKGIKVGIITAEDRKLNQKRAEKLSLDFLYQGVKNKLPIVENICQELGIQLANVAYVGDDTGDYEVLCNVGIKACPSNANRKIKNIPGIIQLNKKGGDGVLREFVELLYKDSY